ncbi:MAG: cytochrome c [Nitrospira sp.]|nr:cytochrome c [Nitrospira sp.]MBS0153445.1 cytochrome c [Nitrospira sp.]MBS0165116.1 cytochrome c [Nitrospira sp.]
MATMGRMALLWGVLVWTSAVGFSHLGIKEFTTSTKGGDAVTGREIYVNTCILCHGIDGKGVRGLQFVPPPADLTTLAVQSRLDGTLFRRIHDGKPNTVMGAWKHALSDEEIWDVLAYVRTFRIESPGQP